MIFETTLTIKIEVPESVKEKITALEFIEKMAIMNMISGDMESVIRDHIHTEGRMLYCKGYTRLLEVSNDK